MGWVERVRGLKAELDGLRPLPAGSLAALDAWYDVELTFTSYAIEGNALTRNETAIVLEKGITVSRSISRPKEGLRSMRIGGRAAGSLPPEWAVE